LKNMTRVNNLSKTIVTVLSFSRKYRILSQIFYNPSGSCWYQCNHKLQS